MKVERKYDDKDVISPLDGMSLGTKDDRSHKEHHRSLQRADKHKNITECRSDEQRAAHPDSLGGIEMELPCMAAVNEERPDHEGRRDGLDVLDVLHQRQLHLMQAVDTDQDGGGRVAEQII